MEGKEAQTKNESPKSPLEIRSVKVANQLSSLRSSSSRRLILNQINTEEEKETLKKEKLELEVKLVKERMKNRKIKLCGLMELLLQLMLLLSLLFAFFLVFLYTCL